MKNFIENLRSLNQYLDNLFTIILIAAVFNVVWTLIALIPIMLIVLMGNPIGAILAGIIIELLFLAIMIVVNVVLFVEEARNDMLGIEK